MRFTKKKPFKKISKKEKKKYKPKRDTIKDTKTGYDLDLILKNARKLLKEDPDIVFQETLCGYLGIGRNYFYETVMNGAVADEIKMGILKNRGLLTSNAIKNLKNCDNPVAQIAILKIASEDAREALRTTVNLNLPDGKEKKLLEVEIK